MYGIWVYLLDSFGAEHSYTPALDVYVSSSLAIHLFPNKMIDVNLLTNHDLLIRSGDNEANRE